MRNLVHYEHLAALFDYPETDYPAHVQRAYALLEDRYPLAAAELRVFVEALETDGESYTAEALDEIQEIYTRSFDVQAITTLGVGYVMFGDDYKRGELFVNLSREYADIGIDCGTELADHLPTVLRLIARWQEEELITELVEELLHPALHQMIAEFGSQRCEQRNKLYQKHYKTLIASSEHRGTMFRAPLSALLEVLKEDFALSDWQPPEQDNDFLRSVGRELEIEATAGKPAPSGRMP
jgi:nitrate reductase assembly molybdenum cofactor insertion protein NarJ